MIYNIFRLSQNQNYTISGPPVDDLISIVKSMFSMGAPVEYDDIGFNKAHYNDYILNKIANTNFGDSLEIQDIAHAMRALRFIC